MTSNRTHRPPTGCPYCGAARVAPHHFRDQGETPAAEAIASGHCPVLVSKRSPRGIELAPSDAREAARLDDYFDSLSAEEMAGLFARAMKAEVL